MRKKVKSEIINNTEPKKRTEKKPTKKTSSDQRWDKVIGVKGKIIRIRQDEYEKFVEIGELVSKGKAARLGVGVDDDYLYHYFELIK